MDTGRAFKLALTILREDGLKLLVPAALVIGLPDVATTYVMDRFVRSDGGLIDPRSWALLVAMMLVSMLSWVALQAIVAHRFEAARRPIASDGPSDFMGRVFDILALGLVTSLGILGGFVLLLIPGIILSLAWFVAVPAMVTERLGVMAAIRRSNALTGKARGAIFGLTVAVGIAGYVLSWLIQLIAGAAGNAAVDAITAPVLQTVTSLVNAVLAVAIYDELRWSQEGAREDSLAAIFS